MTKIEPIQEYQPKKGRITNKIQRMPRRRVLFNPPIGVRTNSVTAMKSPTTIATTVAPMHKAQLLSRLQCNKHEKTNPTTPKAFFGSYWLSFPSGAGSHGLVLFWLSLVVCSTLWHGSLEDIILMTPKWSATPQGPKALSYNSTILLPRINLFVVYTIHRVATLYSVRLICVRSS